MDKKNELPEKLRALVRFSIDSYGQAIESTHGEKVLADTEKLRQELKLFRKQEEAGKFKFLKDLYHQFNQKTDADLYRVAHIFSLYMEIINRCEGAYRHYRLLDSKPAVQKAYTGQVIYVFTAHPTEARSRNAMNLLNEVEAVLGAKLVSEGGEDESLNLQLRHLFNLLLRVPLSKTKKPSVKDEAEHIYSVVLEPDLLDEHIRLVQSGMDIRFRTWVGGDKDGHPFVDDQAMVESWRISRQRLLAHLNGRLARVGTLLNNLPKPCFVKVSGSLSRLKDQVRVLAEVSPGDGKRVARLKQELIRLDTIYLEQLGVNSPELASIMTLLSIYPALVVPLELREDSELVQLALEDRWQPIGLMLKRLSQISRGGVARDYARGFVLSMTQSSQDVVNGIRLMKKHLQDQEIPVVPLLETQAALENGSTIVTEVIAKEKAYMKLVREKWKSHFEIMLGYSDSSKENGVLLSRVLISKAIKKLDGLLKENDLIPVFFHGSGGSLERGGGSLQNQVSWWPKSVLQNYKSTVQGEMIARNFGDPQIMRSICTRVAGEFEKRQGMKPLRVEKELLSLAKSVAESYQDLIGDPRFVEVVKQATPYLFLDQLKIGSRPSKRQQGDEEFKMRAIPWVLCWTQARVLLPVWWGLGSFWSQASEEEKAELKKLYQESDLLKSFMNILGFTLSKVEMSVFRLYLDRGIVGDRAESIFQKFSQEFEGTTQFYSAVTGQQEFMWFRKWLGSSIRYRAPMIHPLNVIQLVSIERKNMALLREATTGIACGMLTTG